MKKLLLSLCALAVFVAMVSTTEAFDGNRKGFVLGGGLGFAPTATWNSEPINSGIGTFQLDESHSGPALNLLFGYAWTEHDMIVYEGNVVGYSINDVNISQGFNGISWYMYFGPVGNSAFLSGGFGAYVLRVDGENADMGEALQFGFGYEFKRHLQVGAYVGTGLTRDPFIKDVDYSHTHFSILVSGVAF